MSDRPSFAPPALTAAQRLSRQGRLVRKELREILRDRRTIITLVLMPLLLYPLLSLTFQQFFLTRMATAKPPEYRVAFASATEYEAVRRYLGQVPPPPARTPAADVKPQEVKYFQVDPPSTLEEVVRDGRADVGARLPPKQPRGRPGEVAVDLELVVNEGSPLSGQAADFLERWLRDANAAFLERRLTDLRVPQRATPVASRRSVVEGGLKAAPISLSAVVPLILILMTITGAVYPAIDLTAGERERGTLEVLIAAPVPRLGLLLAKYAAVLTVAMLTAGVNLVTMTVTIAASGLGPMLFGEGGLTVGVAAGIAGLLFLFASFFSALLLTLTSFARSFKEAQAYLIPLMLVSMAPGLAGLVPGLELRGPLVFAPLVNIVLLGRDMLDGVAGPWAVAAVAASTLVYAVIAVAAASRVFGDEAVLYNSGGGWGDLARRPAAARPAASPRSAWGLLLVLFPLYFFAQNALLHGSAADPVTKLLLAAVVTAALFGALPLVAAWHRRLDVATALGFRRPSPLAVAAAVLLGLSLWPFAHELVLLQQTLGLIHLSSEQIDRVNQMIGRLREVPAAVVVACLAIVPAVFEEVFFRGYVFHALLAADAARPTRAVRRRSPPWGPVFASAVAFGLFHVVGQGLNFERFLSSGSLGVVLALVAWRSGSVVPGIVLHATHNGFLTAAAYYKPQLAARGWFVQEESHLPAAWLAAAAVVVLIAGAILAISRRPPGLRAG